MKSRPIKHHLMITPEAMRALFRKSHAESAKRGYEVTYSALIEEAFSK